MGLFGALIRTAVNVVTLPVAVVKDVVSLGGSIDNNGRPHLVDHLQKLKDEAEEE